MKYAITCMQYALNWLQCIEELTFAPTFIK